MMAVIRSTRLLVALLLLTSCKTSRVRAFQACRVSSPSPSVAQWRISGRTLWLSSTNPVEDAKNEATLQKDALAAMLVELEGLKTSVLEASDKETLESLQQSLATVEATVKTQVSSLIPPTGMTMSEYVAALRMYTKLPVRSRVAFCKALDIENPTEAALEFDRIPDVVAMLWAERNRLTPSALEAAMKSTEKLVITKRTTPLASRLNSSLSKKSFAGAMKPNNSAGNAEDEVDEELEQVKNLVQQMWSRTTRQENRSATSKDLETLMKALGRDTFIVSSKEEIPGGFLLRGRPSAKLTTAEALLEAIDNRLPGEWSCQVSLSPDFTASARGEDIDEESRILWLCQKDMSPEPRTALRICSSLTAVATAFLFSVGVYGGNNMVMSRLEETSTTGDYVGFEWFTERTFEVLLPLMAIQLLHELGHFAISQRDGLKTTTPTLLPGWGLPFLGCLNNFKESPKNLTSLFDFALAGPVLGLLASLGFFVSGLELTNAAGAEAIQYLPALPVDILRSSTLAGSLVDSILGGGQGFITLQDPKTSVPLHPFAIAGFTGILANALALLPLGSTDGGRASMTIFGRPGHLIMGSVVWLFLLISSFTFERADALIGAWVVYNIVQNDHEVPCRDEVTEVDAFRIVAAFGLWFTAILAIVPLQ